MHALVRSAWPCAAVRACCGTCAAAVVQSAHLDVHASTAIPVLGCQRSGRAQTQVACLWRPVFGRNPRHTCCILDALEHKQRRVIHKYVNVGAKASGRRRRNSVTRSLIRDVTLDPESDVFRRSLEALCAKTPVVWRRRSRQHKYTPIAAICLNVSSHELREMSTTLRESGEI